jgi:hypothetical protein
MTLYGSNICVPLDLPTFTGSACDTCMATSRNWFLLSARTSYLESVCIHVQTINLHHFKSIISLGLQRYIRVKGTC